MGEAVKEGINASPNDVALSHEAPSLSSKTSSEKNG
jgi:hypothetical protein